MTILTTCPNCHRTRLAGTPCRCTTKRRRTPEAIRRANNPWVRVYGTAEYRRARTHALHQASHQCTAIIDGHRCTATTGLHAHHKVKIRTLYTISETWKAYVQAATDPHALLILCAVHHPTVEAPTKHSPRIRCPHCHSIQTSIPCKDCQRLNEGQARRDETTARRQAEVDARAEAAEAKERELEALSDTILEMREHGTKWRDITLHLGLKSSGHAHNILTAYHPEYMQREDATFYARARQ